MNKKINLAIYSTYCGSSENSSFKKKLVDKTIDHFFISNNEKILKKVQKFGWKPIFLNQKVSKDPILSAYQAKIAKTMPHKFSELTNYDYTFYIDDKLIPNTIKVQSSIDILNKSNSCLGIRSHPWLRDNVLYEFGESLIQPRYKFEWAKTVNYITNIIKKGYKLECQMYWTSAILRNMKHKDAVTLNEIWYDHINKCGIDCQISFNFISQKFNTIAILPKDICY